MSWTKFKEKHLFSINLALVASFILWQVRKDFDWHPLIAGWLVLGFFVSPLRTFERKAMLTIGKINGTVLLGLFYFVALTPFSVLYRLFFRNRSFRKLSSTFEEKNSVSAFDRPF